MVHGSCVVIYLIKIMNEKKTSSNKQKIKYQNHLPTKHFPKKKNLLSPKHQTPNTKTPSTLPLKKLYKPSPPPLLKKTSMGCGPSRPSCRETMRETFANPEDRLDSYYMPSPAQRARANQEEAEGRDHGTYYMDKRGRRYPI